MAPRDKARCRAVKILLRVWRLSSNSNFGYAVERMNIENIIYESGVGDVERPLNDRMEHVQIDAAGAGVPR
jgi:hypothetical protein